MVSSLSSLWIAKARGMRTRQAIIEGGVTRMTPVLLTASATIIRSHPVSDWCEYGLR